MSQRAERQFLLFGAAYWAEKGAGPFYLAPFELEFEFAVDESRTATRIVARFGRLDERDRIGKTPRSAGPGSLVARRPTRDKDWAFAVELS
ncbi:hypothetical protein PLANPX_3604 [Lacipirellula parvula]|uniref:Uncharacterized protein n=1 Tax=Lacipirellula parvula TaxID=2650471 RepID=A0A5K7XDC2_9BACT|nr:hypothetical protein PLANPX_3604 [Lacipirellula parvula]